MDYLIMKHLNNRPSLEKTRHTVLPEMAELGEDKLIELLKEILKPGDLESCYRAFHFRDLLDYLWYFSEDYNFKFKEKTKLNFMYTMDVQFKLYSLYHIPIEYWTEKAKAFCQLLLKYLDSDYNEIEDLPEYGPYQEKYFHLEDEFRMKPQFYENFNLYSTEMGN